jgi:tRNA pseudouridine55 synthase
VPPMVSALRHQGRRLHELARAGLEVERAARPVVIESFELLSFTPPRARFRVACSKGTYVRALVRDVGDALGCGATLTALRRTRSGSFTLADAVPLEAVSPASPLVSPADAVAHLPTLVLDAAGVRAIRHGKTLPLPASLALEATPVRLLTPDGALAALAESRKGELASLRVFNYGLTPVGP